ncbi:MAG: GDSL-type esterase/lipase family protein [Lepagella sp.]
MKGNNPNSGVIVILLTAIIIITALSSVPWGSLTNNVFKDYNLLGDIMPREESAIETSDDIDPELAKIEAESLDSTTSELPPLVDLDSIDESIEAPRRDGVILIEDYYSDKSGLKRLKSALAQSRKRTVRVAVIGDSYIEGDIFTQDLREALQSRYGGCGVGYIPAYCNIAGFRRSVRQSGKGWHEHEIRNMKNNDYRIIAGKYFVGHNGATASFEGVKSPTHLDSWDRTLVQVVSPTHSGTITLTADDGNTVSKHLEASRSVQTIRMDAHTSSIRLSSTVDSLIVLGVYLDGNVGVSVDCMTLRGNSGICHRVLNSEINSQMRQTADYDLIILEFGINALSAKQKNYNYYAKVMAQVVKAVQENYPNAAVMLMGIGDRGRKHGGEVESMSTCQAMVSAQRSAARFAGCLFWDTRAAQGGDGAVVDWHKQGWVNSDYIHLNHKGGKELASLFMNSLNISLSE